MAGTSFLVTGCAGFIGGHMLERLVAEGHEVTGVDDFSTGSRDNLAPTKGKIRFIEGDIRDAAVAAEATRGVERIIHLASIPSVPRSVAEPRESAEASIIGTVSLLDAARRAGVKRVVQASSSSVYGDSDVLPRVETILPDPLSPYAVAKLTQEYYAKAFTKCYGLDTASLRYFNVFGPRQNPESKYAAVIPRFATMMLSGQTPEIYGDGEQTRDFTYIDNVVEANLRAALYPEPLRGEAMNVGGGEGVTLRQLVERINRLLGAAIEPVFAPERLGDVRHSIADIGKARRLFGFSPAVDFAEGLALTVAYYKNAA